MLRKAPFAISRGALLLLALPLLASALAHGDDHGHSMDMAHMTTPSNSTITSGSSADGNGEMSYFAYDKHVGAIIAHVVLMVLGWFFILPIGVMFSIARHRLALPVQFLFLVVNAFGVLLGIVYNSQTPDLYENNVHHKIGWIATGVMSAQVLMALVFAYSGRDKETNGASYERVAFLPVSTADSTHEHPSHAYRWSGDSGQGTESSSLHSRNSSPTRGRRMSRPHVDDDFEKPEPEFIGEGPASGKRLFRNKFLDSFLSSRIPGMFSNRILGAMNVVYVIIERTILILGFIAIVTGGVVYGGIFRAHDIFNGLAHFIKGGIFFWYGLLTLGRWMGCFADFGWAWNLKPSRAMVGKWKSRMPSGEFTESFVIFLYGSTNVFLEHLAAWGQGWSASDLEHVSISIMFFGGGLCGMLIESKRIRGWMNATVLPPPAQSDEISAEDSAAWQEPQTQRVPLNPMPAVVILLLGLMMSSHHQDSMVSTMVHKQWGMLLIGFALARGVTYIILTLNPPKSYLPYRPPSELVASFCLISGGLIFMASTRDVIKGMEYHNLHAMFVLTVGMGFTAFVMAWEILAIALKAWATRKTALPAATRGF
ncbi:hypothetical protein AJ80_01748 [Polytolypa hystricis UAMH7299]|uniref:Integral membrane protein n=1 Tax=Polytolypa hystricis (strain UAMH7299) TaxID=1447883 RepID=A0A2B7Z052_POLH7|nr:hypothetical protein AJ80_01748 [Polytolypa hystricis UAMH7299]